MSKLNPVKQFNFRMPVDLYLPLVEAARNANMSMAKFIIMLIRERIKGE